MKFGNRLSDFKRGISCASQKRKRMSQLSRIRNGNRRDVLQKRRLENGNKAPQNSRLQEPDFNISQLKHIVNGVKSNDEYIVLDNVVKMRKVLAKEGDDVPCELIFESGVVPRLLKIIEVSENDRLLLETTWVITNLASGEAKWNLILISAGVIPVLARCLLRDDDDVKEQACWALSNLSGDSTLVRDTIFRPDIFKSFLSLCAEDAVISSLCISTWTLLNICRQTPLPDCKAISYIVGNVVPVLIIHQDEEVVINIAWVLSYLAGHKPESDHSIMSVIQSGVVPKLVEMLEDENLSIAHPALRTLGTLVTGNDSQTQEILRSGLLRCLPRIIECDNMSMRKEACWTVSNIAAGGPHMVQILKEQRVLPKIIQAFKTDTLPIKGETLHSIYKMMASGKLRTWLLSKKIIPTLCNLLEHKDMLLMTLQIIGIFLEDGGNKAIEWGTSENDVLTSVEECGGLEKIEGLLYEIHDDPCIEDLAGKLVKKYLDNNDMDGDYGGMEQVDKVFVFNMDEEVSMGEMVF